MSRSQGYELISIAWLALAAFDKPVDAGSLLYGLAAGWAMAPDTPAGAAPTPLSDLVSGDDPACIDQGSVPALAPDLQYVIDLRHGDSLCAHESA